MNVQIEWTPAGWALLVLEVVVVEGKRWRVEHFELARTQYTPATKNEARDRLIDAVKRDGHTLIDAQ